MELYFNPSCSKCRSAKDILEHEGVEVEEIRYLDSPLSHEDLRLLMRRLGIDDPRAMMRTGESVYAELGLATADGEALLDAITQHPILLERPIFVRDDRAVIGRPPDKVRDLL